MNSFLQNYGLMIVAVIITLGLIIFATAFGTTITDGIKDITATFFAKSGTTKDIVEEDIVENKDVVEDEETPVEPPDLGGVDSQAMTISNKGYPNIATDTFGENIKTQKVTFEKAKALEIVFSNDSYCTVSEFNSVKINVIDAKTNEVTEFTYTANGQDSNNTTIYLNEISPKAVSTNSIYVEYFVEDNCTLKFTLIVKPIY